MNPKIKMVTTLLPSKSNLLKILWISLIFWAMIALTIFYVRHQESKPALGSLAQAFGSKSVSGSKPKKDEVRDLSSFDVESHIMLGSQHLENDRPDKALEHFFRAEVMVRDNAELNAKIGNALYLVGNFEEAEDRFRNVLSDDKNNAELRAQLGLAVFQQNKIDEAVAILNRSIKTDSSCGECYSALGTVLGGVTPERPGAHEAFFHAMVLSPDNPDVYYQYCRYLMERSRFDEALPVLKHIVDISPLNGKAHARLGLNYYYLNLHRKAKHHYEIALRINEDDYNTWYNLGELYYSVNNDSSTALKHFLKAITLNGAHAKSHFKVGLIYLQNQQIKEAVRHFEIGLSVVPKDTRMLFQLAVAYEKLHMISEALSVYNNILEINPLNKIAKYKIDLIAGR